MTATTTTAAFPCPRCGMVLFMGNLACPNCGALVYAQRLNELSREAQREEQSNRLRAAMIWREALPLLPPDSNQYQAVLQRIGMLTSNMNGAPARPAPAASGGWSSEPITAPPGGAAAARPVPANDPLPLAVAKTLGSMLISIVIYAWLFSGRQGLDFGIKFATGFVLLILVHELGHSMAMRYFRLSASPPIFIPFLGALINLRQMPRNAWEEAVVGIAGPVTGTLAAGVTYVIYLQTGWMLFLRLAEFGFLLNLFNMLPVPPLDGGRVTAAVNPWVWIAGLMLVVLYMGVDWLVYGRFNFLFILLLLMAWPRIASVLAARRAGAAAPYFDIGRAAKWTMGVAYLVLSGLLAVMYFLSRWESFQRFGSSWIG